MKPYYQDNACTIYFGDCVTVLREMEDNSVHCCVTSPPFWGLRDYGCDGQIGLEKTPEEYVAKLVAVFREVNRVLRDDGTLWLNLGDSYNSSSQNNHGKGGPIEHAHLAPKEGWAGHRALVPGLKPKDLVGIPWRVAFALQADGWYLRSDIVWHKPNPMPESVTDRPTKAHEYIFLLSKNERYFYDAEAIKEKIGEPVRMAATFRNGGDYTGGNSFSNSHKVEKDSHGDGDPSLNGRNKRTVWTVATSPFSDWAKTVRWQRVSTDEISCGNLHIASPNCPDYGGLFDLLATALYDGRGDGDWSRIAGICDRLSLTPKDDFAPFDSLHAWNFLGKRLDSVVRQCCEPANDRSIENRKMDLFVSTTLSCKPSDERDSRIRRILAQCGSSEQHLDMLLSNTWLDGFADNQKPQTPYRIVGKHTSLSCGAVYAKKTVETSHFATYPPDLIKPCILAGTSARGCCPKCGAQWERVVNRAPMKIERSNRTHELGRTRSSGTMTSPAATETIGWQPGCDCEGNTPIPCTVIDPFGGSGTTGQVAIEHGRKAILIELNPKYVQLAQRRTNVTPGLTLA